MIGFLLLITALLSCCSSPPQNYIILCAGDSLTEEGYPPYLKSLLKHEGYRAKVLNEGKSGHTSKQYLDYLTKNKTTMAKSCPDFILVQLGTNDVRIDHDHTPADAFYAHMKKIVHIFSEFKTRTGEKSRIFIATIPPVPQGTPFPFSSDSVLRVPQEINPLIQKIAREENLILVDNFSVFLDSPQLLPDVHPSDQGYKALAQTWHNALKKQGMKSSGKT